MEKNLHSYRKRIIILTFGGLLLNILKNINSVDAKFCNMIFFSLLLYRSTQLSGKKSFSAQKEDGFYLSGLTAFLLSAILERLYYKSFTCYHLRPDLLIETFFKEEDKNKNTM